MKNTGRFFFEISPRKFLLPQNEKNDNPQKRVKNKKDFNSQVHKRMLLNLRNKKKLHDSF